MKSAGKGRYRVWAREERIGKDIIITIGGGERPHIGSVIVCEPGRKTKTISLPTHKDYVIGKPIAEKVCRREKKRVVCVCGVHVNNASEEEIDLLVKNGRELERKI
jgi:hypothetical protein